MNPKSLITAGLLAVGLISSASAATGDGVFVTITGSTAFRAVIYSACKAPGIVFASAASGAPADPVVVGPDGGNGANDICFEGYIKNADTTYTKYDLVASWTGSEAGIAAVCGLTSLNNDTPEYANEGGTDPSPMPGVPPAYLMAPGFTVKGTPGAVPTDIAMADTSQAVSLTKNTGGATALVGGEKVGIVPFTWLKAKNATPSGLMGTAWGHLTNVTHPAVKRALGGAQKVRLFTGNDKTIDSDTLSVVVVGRNKGSGTRVNQLLDSAYGLTTDVDQFAFKSTYVAPGVLTFVGPVGALSDADLLEVGNDGFDSGGSVSSILKCDCNSSHYLPIGFLGIPDAIGLDGTGGAKAGGAVLLTLDGVMESNAAIENAQYTAWGHETIYGKNGQLTTDAAGKVKAKLVTGIPAQIVANSWGVTPAAQDPAIPLSLMHADKSGDIGYPFTN